MGEVQGAYRMQQTGEKQVDRLLHLWVVVDDMEIDRLKRMVQKIGQRLGQECMYFEVGESQVEFLPALDDEDDEGTDEDE